MILSKSSNVTYPFRLLLLNIFFRYSGVNSEEDNGKMGKHNYAEGVIRLVEGRLDVGNCHSISRRDW